jgi:hypothetical protein
MARHAGLIRVLIACTAILATVVPFSASKDAPTASAQDCVDLYGDHLIGWTLYFTGRTSEQPAVLATNDTCYSWGQRAYFEAMEIAGLRPRTTPTPTPTPVNAQPQERWSAIAHDASTGRWGTGTDASTLSQAQNTAITACGASGCSVATWTRNGYGSLAVGKNGGWGTGNAVTSSESTNQALSNCRSVTTECRIVVTVGASDGYTSSIYVAPTSTSACITELLPIGCYSLTSGSYVYGPPAGFCNLVACIENFDLGQGYIVQCRDMWFSRSGGIQGSCSGHGGNSAPLLKP